jgi:hypothetical protein
MDDHDSCVSLRYSSIICLTTLAEMYNLLAKHPLATTSSSEFSEKCKNALRGVVSMTEGLEPDDFNHLDPFLGVRPIFYRNERNGMITGCYA